MQAQRKTATADPIFAAIGRHAVAARNFDAAFDIAERTEAESDIDLSRRIGAENVASFEAFLSTVPETKEGALAAVGHFVRLEVDEEHVVRFLDTLSRSPAFE